MERVIVKHIPDELKKLNSWVGWRRINDTKVPFDLRFGGNASSTDKHSWCSFDVALAELQNKPAVAGLGVVLVDDVVGIDLDHCIKNMEVEEWASDIVNHCDSYTEVSPSGCGLRIFCRGVLPIGRRKTSKGPGVEMYDKSSPRFLTVTGRVYRPRKVEDRFDEVKELHRLVFGEDVRTAKDEKNIAVIENIKAAAPASHRICLAKRWLSRRPGTKSGSGAHNYLLALAMAVVWGFGLEQDEAFDVLYEWGQKLDQVNEWGQWYPWSVSEIRHKIRSAMRKHYTETPGLLLYWEDRALDSAIEHEREQLVETIIGGTNV